VRRCGGAALRSRQRSDGLREGKRPRRTIVDTKSFTRQSAKKSYPPVEVMVGERSKTERKRRRQVAVKSQQNKEVCCLVSW
jgi:hypothetical protein